MKNTDAIATMTLPNEVAASYRYCQGVARRAASNFYWSFWLLPPEQRRAMFALYAFAHEADELADGNGTRDERRAGLEAMRAALQTALAGNLTGPLLPALVDVVRQHAIPERYLYEILAGVSRDVDEPQFETFDELRGYCYQVASSAGLACLHIWGFRGEEALPPAIDCGIAFQLTNILRDLKEDAARGRIYLPREDLRRFGYTVDDLQQSVCDERFRQLMRFEAERAEAFYSSGARTLKYLSPHGQRVFGMMFATYRGLLRKIQRRRHDVFGPRIRLGLFEKSMIATRAAFGFVDC